MDKENINLLDRVLHMFKECGCSQKNGNKQIYHEKSILELENPMVESIQKPVVKKNKAKI